VVEIPYRMPEPALPGKEYWLNVSLSVAEALPWAPAGHELAWEQFRLPVDVPAVAPLDTGTLPALGLDESGDGWQVRGDGFDLSFDGRTGLLTALTRDGRAILRRGPVTNLWRAPTDNDRGAGPVFSRPYGQLWKEAGLDRLSLEDVTVEARQAAPAHVTLDVDGVLRGEGAAFDLGLRYDVLGNGDVLVEQELRAHRRLSPLWRNVLLGLAVAWALAFGLHRLTGRRAFRRWWAKVPLVLLGLVTLGGVWLSARDYRSLDPLPRVGMEMLLPAESDHIEWYGRGPHESYPDRKTGARVGRYRGGVAEQHTPYTWPQENGNKTDVRWLTLTDDGGVGVLVSGKALNASVHAHTLANLTEAEHTYELRPADHVVLNVDLAQAGLGSEPFISSVLPEYLLDEPTYRYRYRMRAVDLGRDDLEALLDYTLP
jgi:hypothetical protein